MRFMMYAWDIEEDGRMSIPKNPPPIFIIEDHAFREVNFRWALDKKEDRKLYDRISNYLHKYGILVGIASSSPMRFLAAKIEDNAELEECFLVIMIKQTLEDMEVPTKYYMDFLDATRQYFRLSVVTSDNFYPWEHLYVYNSDTRGRIFYDLFIENRTFKHMDIKGRRYLGTDMTPEDYELWKVVRKTHLHGIVWNNIYKKWKEGKLDRKHLIEMINMKVLERAIRSR